MSIAPGRVSVWGWPLVALRIAAMLALLVVSVPLYYLCVPFSARNPIPRFFLAAVGYVAGLDVRIIGEKPANPAFILANHVSWLDILALAGSTGSAFVAHDGLARIAPLRWLCEMNDTVFIARHERRTVGQQVEQIRTALSGGRPLTIFPEGTTSDGTTTLPFKSSLLSAMEGDGAVPVYPVLLDYGPQARDIAWVGEEPGLANALRILARWRPVTLTLRILAPLDEETRGDRKRMAIAARSAIEAARSPTNQRVAL